MKISQITYRTDFYWKGERYKQIIRPKRPKGKFIVVCSLKSDPYSKWLDMPSGRKVKPVLNMAEFQKLTNPQSV